MKPQTGPVCYSAIQSNLIRMLCLCWLATKILSYQVWLIEYRAFPVVPVLDFPAIVSPLVHAMPFYVSMACLLVLVAFPKNLVAKIAVVLCTVFSGMLDFISVQPWEYQFAFTIAVALFTGRKPDAFCNAFIFILAVVYIYSGLQKLNGGFLYSVWDTMILKRMLGMPKSAVNSLHYAGVLLPLIEVFAGLLILTVKTRLGASLLIIMHLLILPFLMSSQTFHINPVIPWNIGMIAFLTYIFFTSNLKFSFKSMTVGINKMVLVWGLLPALSPIGLWPKDLSFSLWSGNSAFLNICFNGQVPGELKPYLSDKKPSKFCDGDAHVSIYNWSFRELGVLYSTDEWYMRKLKSKFEQSYPDCNATFYTYEYPFKTSKQLR